ncbi:ATP-binding SpoIIE family protein phosphatase [Kineococcus rhizosphaerae]|uniref:PAS domain S-box-containing protein n=1 Tax=Kineococcus rhizosphaerae TaxID=559628 RepID=A0A2T0QWY4_9ACTN|nr:SpoIIE family protein phosphatase [Kineococcus rhizosphaerae]PRY10082.1 PAS domain S-box-containing protein [Kineococcus rhizosphaerae]
MPHAPDLAAVFEHLPTAHLLLDRDLVVAEVNRAYTALLDRTREELVGHPVFAVFPPDPANLDADGVHPLERSFRRALAGGTDVLPALQYDVLDPRTGQRHLRHWSIANVPLPGPDGTVQFVLQRIEDITDTVLERARSERVETELLVRGQEVEASRRAEQAAARTVAAQALVALQLTDASTHAEAQQVLREFARLVLDATSAAVTLLDEHPPGTAAGVVTAAGCTTLVQAPVVVDGIALGEYALGWEQPRELSEVDRGVVEAAAAQYGQTVVRLRARDVERLAAANALALAETLQRSLLPRPARLDGLAVTARYQAAALQARVGGDWYDGFSTADGTTTLTVGDVSGHDGKAAALMGQVRSLLRGIAYAVPADAGELLDILDDALFDLGVDALASAVLLTVHTGADGTRSVRWSNAGHPPPLVLLPDGSVDVLARDPELLLGCRTGTGRSVHEHPFPDGATLLLYTDGLVERRDRPVDDGIADLRARTAALAHLSPDELCDRLVAELARDAEDDVVLLLARAVPVGGPRLDELLPPTATAAARARHLVQESCRLAGIPDETADTATLLVSEAVTNAVVHGRGPVRLVLDVDADRVHLEVSDAAPAAPVRREIDLEAVGGRGLQLIDALASAWGVRADPPGKTVWLDVH